ncbi:MAG: HNH endonuclease family protein [Nitrososphaera sp.]
MLDSLNLLSGKAASINMQRLINPLIEEVKQLVPYCFAQGSSVTCQCETSMLEVVERMELYIWTWYQGDFPKFVQDDYHDNIFRYILREYEAELNHGANIHFDGSKLQLEHIFPQHPSRLPPEGYGFTDPNDYERFLNRIGNLTFVSNNQSLGSQLPEAKAPIYADPNLSSQTPMVTQRVGVQLRSLAANHGVYRNVLEVRCTELAIFSLKRFNAQCHIKKLQY